MELLGITYTGWVEIAVALSMAVLTGLMFILGTNKVHYTWGLFCLATTMWAGTFYMVTQAHDPEVATFWWKIAYVAIILIPFTFLHFTLEFIGNTRFNKHRSATLVALYATALMF